MTLDLYQYYPFNSTGYLIFSHSISVHVLLDPRMERAYNPSMSQSAKSRFESLPTQVRNLVQERTRISEWIERCNLIQAIPDKKIESMYARLLYLSTDYKSSAWKARFRILQSINSTKRGKTNVEILENLKPYGFDNASTLRGHLHFLHLSGAIEKTSNGRWMLNRQNIRIIEDIFQ